MDNASDSGEQFQQKSSCYEEFFVISQRIKKIYDKIWLKTRQECGLTQNEIMILLLLKNHPVLDTSADIAEYCSLSKSLVCKSVDALMQNEYLEIETDRKDKRYQHLILTSRANMILKKLQKVRETLWNVQKEDISEEEMNAFFLTVMKMRNNLERITGIKKEVLRMNYEEFNKRLDSYTEECLKEGKIDLELYGKYEVKRGLRDQNGNGVLAGLTKVSRIDSNIVVDGEKLPCDGKLFYRGVNIRDIISGLEKEQRYGFEEVAHLLLFSELPKEEQLKKFKETLAFIRKLPTNFVRDVVMKAPTQDIMNSLSKSILTLASYDSNVDDISVNNVLRQCMSLISVMPLLAVYSYHAYNHYECNESMYIHHPDENLSTAENLLLLLRPDKKYSKLEAHVLDMALILHMEHGGGNNSTFTTHVVTSSGTDTYAAIASAMSSLKGPKHGGANIKVVEMMDDLRKEVEDLGDEKQVEVYLRKLLHREAFDKKGLIYGMGHAVYSKSDPRAEVFKGFVEQLSKEKHREEDFALYSMVERLGPKIITEERRIYKGVSANVDFYSGFVYSMLDIPKELFTPIFAIARIVGWSAHRIEELINVDKIIRPAYRSVMDEMDYVEIGER